VNNAEANRLIEELYRPLSEVLRHTVWGFGNVKTYHPDCYQKFSGEIRLLTSAIIEMHKRVKAFEEEYHKSMVENLAASVSAAKPDGDVGDENERPE
jgi:hypothetical protein